MAAVIERNLERDEQLLSVDELERFRERAADYDAEAAFFSDDFETLRECGYLLQNVPEELGGLGFSLADVARQQRRLAYYAPADALAINMHLYWVGVAADLWHAGDKSLEWLLREAAAGEIFAAGHAESGAGYDKPLLYSNTIAEKVKGGYCFTGHKQFGSLSPVWTRFGIHGVDATDPDNAMIVHAFASRDADGIEIRNTWDVMGMRATRSDDTILDAVFVPDHYVARIVPQGFAGIDQFVLTVYAWALIGFGNVYYGLARSAFDRAVASLRSKKIKTLTRNMAWHAEAQHQVAEMAMTLETIEALLDRTANDWSDRVDHDSLWAAKIVTTKCRAVEGAWQVVDAAFELAGGGSIFRQSGWERVLRDARLGRIHPANAYLAREIVAKTYLGLDPDELPRWG